MKIKLLCVILLSLILLAGCGSDANNRKTEDVVKTIESLTTTETVKPKEVEVIITVQRTGNALTNIGDLEVWIDDEKIFTVDGDSTNGVKAKMLEGEHTIQAKGQGDKSKKVKFYVDSDGNKEFHFTAEISNWYGVKLEEREYIPE